MQSTFTFDPPLNPRTETTNSIFDAAELNSHLKTLNIYDLIYRHLLREFFGSESPYADLLHILTQPSSLLEFPEGRGLKRKEEPLIKTLYLTLLEVSYIDVPIYL